MLNSQDKVGMSSSSSSSSSSSWPLNWTFELSGLQRDQKRAFLQRLRPPQSKSQEPPDRVRRESMIVNLESWVYNRESTIVKITSLRSWAYDREDRESTIVGLRSWRSWVYDSGLYDHEPTIVKQRLWVYDREDRESTIVSLQSWVYDRESAIVGLRSWIYNCESTIVKIVSLRSWVYDRKPTIVSLWSWRLCVYDREITTVKILSLRTWRSWSWVYDREDHESTIVKIVSLRLWRSWVYDREPDPSVWIQTHTCDVLLRDHRSVGGWTSSRWRPSCPMNSKGWNRSTGCSACVSHGMIDVLIDCWWIYLKSTFSSQTSVPVNR